MMNHVLPCGATFASTSALVEVVRSNAEMQCVILIFAKFVFETILACPPLLFALVVCILWFLAKRPEVGGATFANKVEMARLEVCAVKFATSMCAHARNAMCHTSPSNGNTANKKYRNAPLQIKKVEKHFFEMFSKHFVLL